MFDFSILKKPLFVDTGRRWRVYMMYPPLNLLVGLLWFFHVCIWAVVATAMGFFVTSFNTFTQDERDIAGIFLNHPWRSVLVGFALGIFMGRVQYYFTRKNLDRYVDRLLKISSAPPLRKRFKAGILAFVASLVYIALPLGIAIALDLSWPIVLMADIPGVFAVKYFTSRSMYDRVLVRLDEMPGAAPDTAKRVDRNAKRFFYGVMIPLFLAVSVILGMTAVDVFEMQKESQWIALLDYSFVMSEEEAGVLESRLSEDPEDTDARAQLLTYLLYQSHNFDEERGQEMLAEHRAHLLWFIEHDPLHPGAVGNKYSFTPLDYPEDYARARALWLANLENRPGDLELLLVATDFFISNYDNDIALELAERGRARDSRNPEWENRLRVIRARLLKSQESTPEV